MLKTKVLAQLHDLRHQRLGIGGIALVDRDGHRATGARGQQAVVDLQLVLLAVAVMTDLTQRAVRAFEVAGGQVIEGERAFA